MTQIATALTDASLALFLALAKDSVNWNSQPLLHITKEERGNLSDLKKKALLSTFKDEGCEWVEWTPSAHDLAAQHGIQL